MKPNDAIQIRTRRDRSKRAAMCCATFLKKARVEAGLSQDQLAAKLGQSKGYIGRIERGRRRLNVVDFMDVAQAIGKNSADAMRELMSEFPGLFDWCKDAEGSK